MILGLYFGLVSAFSGSSFHIVKRKKASVEGERCFCSPPPLPARPLLGRGLWPFCLIRLVECLGIRNYAGKGCAYRVSAGW